MNKVEKHLEHANRWLDRSKKDFNLFKKLVPFDRKTKKPVMCQDPALAIYLLQQCVEKAVKAAAIASGQYKPRNFTNFYKHNSLALILNLSYKIVDKMTSLGLGSFSTQFGIDFSEGSQKISTLENQVMGFTPLYDKNGKTVDIKKESISLPSEQIDHIIDMVLKLRSITLNTLGNILKNLPDKINNFEINNDIENNIRTLANKAADIYRIDRPTEEQIQTVLEQFKSLKERKLKTKDLVDKNEITTNYLSAWAFAGALYLLTYLTFAHESTARYPLKNEGNISKGEIGCDNYDEKLGIVNRIARLGYATSLTLNEMKNEIETIAFFFALDPNIKPNN